ncbi:hypothetical protein FGO68_gene2530 [Halteria grandinella]|uniref:Uncharacterized protein n=1 Tax=Halteria grandinella TaxID=5974 RepID=A0A8J8P8D1_HALGN|nr:hypothetical protein FGO68_gene2530 [Halteria grandinella]
MIPIVIQATYQLYVSIFQLAFILSALFRLLGFFEVLQVALTEPFKNLRPRFSRNESHFPSSPSSLVDNAFDRSVVKEIDEFFEIFFHELSVVENCFRDQLFTHGLDK